MYIIKNKLILAWRSLGSTRLLFAHFSLEEATALGFTNLQWRCWRTGLFVSIIDEVVDLLKMAAIVMMMSLEV